MISDEYNKIRIPENIDKKIEDGVQKALLEKSKNKVEKRKKSVVAVVASLVAILTLGLTSPALASRIPLIGSVFEAIEKNIHFPGNYSQYATSVNETAYSNGIGITLSDILCDGQSLYVTYVVVNEKPFKYTSWGKSGLMDMNQLLTTEAYNIADFTDERVDNSGFAGLEGKFIDENTFIGVEKYNLSNLKSEIPDEFMFQTKIKSLGNYSTVKGDKDYVKWGTWAFKVPVKVNKELKKVIGLDSVEESIVKVNSLSITPFDIVIDIDYKNGEFHEYRTKIYDENGEELQPGDGIATDNNRRQKQIFAAPSKDSNNIRVVIEKQNSEQEEIILDRVIPLN
ncbi:MAG: DUF4179 domain-containing protein [Clostridium sp.]|uniref:DUF4179 domain-containing protein n=1 Tax=Clostridium sp. TaxID=1506 RepID=UPI00306A0A38